jgi:perosamine synthetase
MERLEEILRVRRRIGHRYDAALADHPYVAPTHWTHDAASNRQTYAVVLDDECPLSRTELLTALRARRVGALPGLACVHREPAYAGSCRRVPLPVSERLSDRMVLLPMFAGMTDEQCAYVVRAVYAAFGLQEPGVVVPAGDGRS